MPSDGPSKEELEYYYKNSRKYFDELAKYYSTADPEYYQKNIAPFYSSFGSLSTGSRNTGPRASLAIVAALVVLALGFAAFLIMQGVQETGSDNPKTTEDAGNKTQREPVQERKTSASDYQKGLDFYNEKDYDNALKYFKRVTEDDENYRDAQKKIEEIGELKKSEQKNDDNDSRDRYRRPKPVERIR